jgi:hypothetical protein
MTFDTELGDRLRAATRSLPDLPDTLDEVMHRGQRRRVASRVAGVGGLALVVVAGVVVALTFGSDTVGPIVDDPPVIPTPAVTEDVTPEPSEIQVGIVTPGEIGWSLLVAGPDGVTWWDGADARIIDTEVAMTAIPLTEGGALLQRLIGGPIVHIAPDGTRRELLQARSELRLHGIGTTEDGTPVGLATWWVRQGEELSESDEQRFGTFDLTTGQVTDQRRTGLYDSGAEHLEVVGGDVLMTVCHLDCRYVQWSLGSDGEVELDQPRASSEMQWIATGWRDGFMSINHDGFADEAGEGPRHRLVFDGLVLTSLPGRLPTVVSVAPDHSAILLASGDPATDATTYIVDRLDEAIPRIRQLSVPGIARFAPFPAPHDEGV